MNYKQILYSARSEFFNSWGKYRGCFKVSRSMIEFVLVDSPNCLDAGDGRNPGDYLATRPESCACDLVHSRSRRHSPGKKNNHVSLLYRLIARKLFFFYEYDFSPGTKKSRFPTF